MSKKAVRTVCLALSLIIASVFLASCERKLTVKKGKVYDSKTGIYYDFVPSTFQPKATSTEEFAVYEINKVRVRYYPIEGAETSEWLYSELGELICSLDVDSLPSLGDFSPDNLLLCYNGDTVFSFDTVNDPDELAAIVGRYTSGTRLEPKYYDHNTYKLMFESAKYPYLYYQLLLVVLSDAMYLYDRNSGVYVEATDLFRDRVSFFAYEEGED